MKASRSILIKEEDGRAANQFESEPNDSTSLRRSEGEWRWYTPVRTALEVPFNFRIYLGETHRYQALGVRARTLRNKGLSWVQIGKKLKISDKTAKKAAQTPSI